MIDFLSKAGKPFEIRVFEFCSRLRVSEKGGGWLENKKKYRHEFKYMLNKGCFFVVFYDALYRVSFPSAVGAMVVERYADFRGAGFTAGFFFCPGKFPVYFSFIIGCCHCRGFYLFFGALSFVKRMR